MLNYIEEIKRLKEEKNAHILAHYYQPDEVQEIADYVGDSYYLSKVGMESNKEIIVFCGVSFMAESAKILSPHKKVLLPNLEAKCSMVELATKENVQKMKDKYPNAKLVSYINSSTDVKSISDACCTSSNALKIVQNIDADEIIFVPDRNLGEYIQEQVPNKKLILWDGFCCVHQRIKAEEIIKYKESLSYATQVLVHPECNKEARATADYIGSTGQIIEYAGKSDASDFIIVTEDGILYQLNKQYSNKKFHNLNIICQPMKRITLKDIYDSLMQEKHEIFLEEETRMQAYKALMKMHELGK
ncbi:MAG: quinolinate synthase [Firmicutes bacterium HGW-Firmicutes-1]|jgi:quinolinate synthase|nr:MAG: quinolinate synthase [Firmicutes bacterium HGW-Firmicutes-1]